MSAEKKVRYPYGAINVIKRDDAMNLETFEMCGNRIDNISESFQPDRDVYT